MNEAEKYIKEMKESLKVVGQQNINTYELRELLDPYEDDAPQDFADEFDLLEMRELNAKRTAMSHASRTLLLSIKVNPLDS